ncbi:MAG: MFS transporter [Rhodoferax sp.]
MPHSTPPTPWFRIALLWLSGISAGLQLAKISLAFDALQAHYGATAATLGGVLSAMGVVGMFAGVGVGLLAPRWGLLRVLVGALALGAAVSLLQASLLPLPWLWASRLLEGLSHLAVVVTAPTLMVQLAGPRHRTLVMGVWGTFVAVAYALGGLLAPWLLAQGVQAWLLAHALLMALAAAAVGGVFRRAPLAPAAPLRAWRGLVAEHRALYGRQQSVLPALCFFCYTSMALAFLTFLPMASGPDRGWVAVLMPLCGAAGTVLAGVLSQRWVAPLRLLALAYLGVAIMGLWAGWRLHHGEPLALAALALMGATGMVAGSALALVPWLNRESSHQAQANGAVAQLGNLGAVCAGPVFGWAWPQGAWVLGTLVLAYCALGLVLVYAGGRRL